jgi:ribosome-associated heat shock protein Hsp15
MRVDKYLWSVRYYKTRSIATQACKKGAVRINDAAVKPSRDVYPGDNVTLRKNQINYSLRVLEVPKSRVGPKLVDLYRVDTTPKEAFQQQELLKYSKEYYRKRGMGRPTKKDRRDIEDYIKEEE